MLSHIKSPRTFVVLLLFLVTSSIVFAAATERAADGYPVWSADNIDMVYLRDSTQFVCDPDGLLSEEYKDSANHYLRQLHSEFDIQTVFVVANHVKNGDAFRMAQDVGNKYGVAGSWASRWASSTCRIARAWRRPRTARTTMRPTA